MTEIYRQVQTTSMELKEIICNRCKKSCAGPEHIDAPAGETCYESATLMASWGYFSKRDGETHRANLCEACYDYVLETCGIKPDIKEW